MRVLKVFSMATALLIAILSFSLIASAHSGSLDDNGGHYNRKTGEYHFHHGYPEHQHPGGVCPYAFNDKTNHDYNGSSSTTKPSTKPIATPMPRKTPSPSPKRTRTPWPSPLFATSTEGGGAYYFHDRLPGHQHIGGYCPYDASITPSAAPIGSHSATPYQTSPQNSDKESSNYDPAVESANNLLFFLAVLFIGIPLFIAAKNG